MLEYIKIILIIIGIMLYILFRIYGIKINKNSDLINKGTIKLLPIFDVMGFSGIIFCPYIIIGMFIIKGIYYNIIIFNLPLFIIFIFSLIIFSYCKLYFIKYSGRDFIVKKLFFITKRYNFEEVSIIAKKTKYIIYKDEKKICTVSYKLHLNSYDFFRKIVKNKTIINERSSI